MSGYFDPLAVLDPALGVAGDITQRKPT